MIKLNKNSCEVYGKEYNCKGELREDISEGTRNYIVKVVDFLLYKKD